VADELIFRPIVPTWMAVRFLGEGLLEVSVPLAVAVTTAWMQSSGRTDNAHGLWWTVGPAAAISLILAIAAWSQARRNWVLMLCRVVLGPDGLTLEGPLLRRSFAWDEILRVDAETLVKGKEVLPELDVHTAYRAFVIPRWYPDTPGILAEIRRRSMLDSVVPKDNGTEYWRV
jgi:hypothetical protein